MSHFFFLLVFLGGSGAIAENDSGRENPGHVPGISILMDESQVIYVRREPKHPSFVNEGIPVIDGVVRVGRPPKLPPEMQLLIPDTNGEPFPIDKP